MTNPIEMTFSSGVITNKISFWVMLVRFLCSQMQYPLSIHNIPGKLISEGMYHKMPFGKHKGMKMEDVPVDCLQWLAGTDLDEDLRYTVEQILKA